MPSEASTAAEDQDRGRSVEELERELSEGHRREAATAEVLHVIGISTHDVQPVFDAIARNAVLLCQAKCGGVFSFDGTLADFKAGYRFTDEALRHLQEEYPIAPRGVIRDAITDRAVVHVVDAFADPRVANVELARKLGYRSHLVVPMLRSGQVIGTINVYGSEARPFSDAQVSVLQTFADQAVIAIENTRLFNETKQALEHQTATSEVLQVISSSVSDAAPVFDKILGSCSRLFQNCVAFLALVGEDELMHLVQSRHGLGTTFTRRLQGEFPRPVRDSIQGYAIHKRQVLHYPDVMYGADVPAALRKTADIIGIGNYSMLNAPMLWEGKGVGALTLSRFPPAPFTEKEISLLKTFADQAVIAIENTRLFEAEQASKRELQQTLEYQTATSEVLNVISRSPTNAQPVFDAIAESARRLCAGDRSAVYRFDGTLIHHIAHHNWSTEGLEVLARVYPRPLSRETQIA